MERSEYKNIRPEFEIEATRIAFPIKSFTEGCRVLFLIQRHKDGGHTNNSKLRSYITRNPTEWLTALAKLLQEKYEYPHLELRIYQTLNARDIEKGIRHFKYAMLDADYYDKESRQNFFIDVRNRIVSALMKPQCAAESYFLYDIDDTSVEDRALLLARLAKQKEVVYYYRTKNGWHIITKPFNPNLVEVPKGAEYKKDAMMLLKY